SRRSSAERIVVVGEQPPAQYVVGGCECRRRGREQEGSVLRGREGSEVDPVEQRVAFERITEEQAERQARGGVLGHLLGERDPDERPSGWGIDDRLERERLPVARGGAAQPRRMLE